MRTLRCIFTLSRYVFVLIENYAIIQRLRMFKPFLGQQEPLTIVLPHGLVNVSLQYILHIITMIRLISKIPKICLLHHYIHKK
jgi:hypothetical protein